MIRMPIVQRCIDTENGPPGRRPSVGVEFRFASMHAAPGLHLALLSERVPPRFGLKPSGHRFALRLQPCASLGGLRSRCRSADACL